MLEIWNLKESIFKRELNIEMRARKSMEGNLMNRALINIDRTSLDSIHAHSLEVLHDTGIRFPSEKALALFKKHGFTERKAFKKSHRYFQTSQ